jgi:hypothetical protein
MTMMPRGIERKSAVAETLIEATISMPEVFESAGDKFHREWAEHSGDWSFQILKFLQGRRVNEVNAAEIITTQTYARSLQPEKEALRWVAEQAEQLRPLSEEDRRRLIERDAFLLNWVDGKTLGHADWVAEIQNIPAAVRRAQDVDAALFPNTFPSRHLFGWHWKTR